MSIDSNALTVVVKSRNSSIQKEENEAVLRNKSRKTKEKEWKPDSYYKLLFFVK